jgi:hypothetical protein
MSKGLLRRNDILFCPSQNANGKKDLVESPLERPNYLPKK